MKKQKPSKLRYKAMLEDVKKRVYYALYTKNYDNPYCPLDKRYDRFEKQLKHTLAIDREFNDMCEFMGTNVESFARRVHHDPGPVRSLDELAKLI